MFSKGLQTGQMNNYWWPDNTYLYSAFVCPSLPIQNFSPISALYLDTNYSTYSCPVDDDVLIPLSPFVPPHAIKRYEIYNLIFHFPDEHLKYWCGVQVPQKLISNLRQDHHHHQPGWERWRLCRACVLSLRPATEHRNWRKKKREEALPIERCVPESRSTGRWI